MREFEMKFNWDVQEEVYHIGDIKNHILKQNKDE